MGSLVDDIIADIDEQIEDIKDAWARGGVSADENEKLVGVIRGLRDARQKIKDRERASFAPDAD